MKLLSLLAVLVLVACTQDPAEIVDRGGAFFGHKSSKVSKASRKTNAQGAFQEITVKRGYTLYGVAKRYGVSSRKIIELNGLKRPYHLQTGQKLVLPKSKYYRVVKGDTLYGVSRKHGVDMSQLVKLNKLRKPYTLKVGQKLQIPSRRYAATKASSPSKRSNTSKTSRSVATSKRGGGGAFAWPVKGKIVSSFGPKKGGVYNDGINISASEGSLVRASDSGTVVYRGNELKGYGNLLIVRHAGGWLTAYAHQKEIRVKRGDKVKRGQVIGVVGKSGKVDRPQLHFAIRKGRDAVDPMKFLSG